MQEVAIKRCTVRIAPKDLYMVDRLYPYTIVEYRDLRPLLMGFLKEHFPNISPETKILAVSQHNGYGAQWGVVVINQPGDITWEIVGKFGTPAHAWHRTPLVHYYMLLERGLVPKNFRGHVGKPVNEPVTVSWLKRLAAWHDKCSTISRFDLFFKGAPAI
jgi:hypothetical protein